MSAGRTIMVFIVLFVVLGAAVLVAALIFEPPAPVTPMGSVLVFDVPRRLEEAPPPPGGNLLELVRRDRPTVWTLSHGIRRAAADSRVKALVLHIDDLEWGWAKVSEIRDAVLEFRRAGKPVYSALAGGGEREYLLASAAGTIASPPLAVLQINGLTASALFLRGTLDKVGVTPNFAQAGRFKSAAESWTRSGMSPPTREALQALVDDQFAWVVDSLAAARRLAPASVVRLMDEGPFTAGDARAQGLIDTLLYEAELDSLATTGTGRPTLSLSRYLARLDDARGGARVALITAVGTIAEGRSHSSPGEGPICGSETIIRALREVRNRSSIRAVVLRIDSPGGSAQAADEIWREVKRCAQSKPLIVSMSDLAASGGYYIAAPADSIVAEAATLTGSIGAFGGKLNLIGLYHKLGLNVETVSRGRHAEMLSPFRDFTPDEAARFQGQMDEVYRLFVRRVSEGRRWPASQVDSVAQGRVWTGLAARRHGLVDALGGLTRAFSMARSRAGIADEQPLTVDVYPRFERTLLQRVLADMVGEEDGQDDVLAVAALPPVVRAWLAAATFPAGRALALMPWSIEIR
jgi:protease IV